MFATDQKPDNCGLSNTAVAFLSLQDDVLALWERQTRERVLGARDLLPPVLINTLPTFFDNIAEALSPSYPRESATSHTNTASAHGSERARMTSFGVDQVIQEYQIFRESIREMARGRVALGPEEWGVIDRSIDSAVVEAVRAFMSSHDELRKRIAASLSHDMRTPLSVIANGAALIGMTDDIEAARRRAAKIETNALRLTEMLGELLDVLTDHVDAEITLELSEFEIQELIEEIADEFSEERLGRCEVLGESVRGFWCRSSLRRALENLASNARKYGDGGVLRIKAQETRERLMLTVHNDGNPIPKERQESMFEYLHRGAETRGATGWGIGLRYVKSVAEAHGGSVAIDSSKEAGTTIIVDLPMDCRPFVAR